MDVHATFYAAAWALALYWVAWIFYARWLHPLSKFPGPPLAAVSRLWIVLHVARGRAGTEQKQLHEKYAGPIIRIAPNELAISDPRAIKTIYGINTGFTKTDFYLTFRAPGVRYPDHFTATDPKSHAVRRRIVNSVYSMTSILQAEEYVDKVTDLFLLQLGGVADNKATINFLHWARMYAYDVIGEFYFGRMFGFLQEMRDHLGYMESTDTMIPVMAVAGVLPSYLRSAFMLSGLLFSSIRQAMVATMTLVKAADEAVEDRLQAEKRGEEQKPDVLTKIFNIYRLQGAKVDLRVEDVKVEAWVAGSFAGSDTTAITLSGILFHIVKNREVYDALVEEIDHATMNDQLSSPHLAYQEASKLPYLDACIKEGMRFHPIVGLTFPRHAPKEGCEVAGHWIPGHARIGVNPAIVHLDTSIFGEDAHSFNPDRWLAPGANNMSQYIMQFGFGSRTCMGKHMAMVEIYKVIPELLRSFHLELESPEDKLDNTSYWFYKPKKVNIKIRRR
ncbi:putative cytochrome P450 [Aspergillus heteromorphus CBS 117.55]|uniref:Putative cytochrome P450 n=1 Tax=Aspergillus heteromorphus CBS 117.55 TaxID=1448321 RepID=A0A317VII1_9EURO|nr:putative cytochrome P450 [Aspergillus heteromorphus CBS 117.55]PWY73041.1 putative cytochrome P450 [Aspergillus heteromorphus CBS 117.55]